MGESDAVWCVVVRVGWDKPNHSTLWGRSLRNNVLFHRFSMKLDKYSCLFFITFCAILVGASFGMHINLTYSMAELRNRNMFQINS